MSNLSKKLSVLTLTSTYPLSDDCTQPAFVSDLCQSLSGNVRMWVLAPHADGAQRAEQAKQVSIRRFRYAPSRWQTLAYGRGMLYNLRENRLRVLLVPFYLASMFLSTLCLTRQARINCIHAHWIFPQGLIAVLVKRLSRRPVKVLVTSHGADLFGLTGRFWRTLNRWVLTHVDHITVVSEAMREVVLQWGIEPTAVTVRSMGLNVNQYHANVQPDMPHELLYVGRLVEKKGVIHLINAMPAVLKQCPSVMLTLVGDGPERAMLEARVEALDLTQAVRFVGAVPHARVGEYYSRAALFIMPSVVAKGGDQEGLGLVALEAMVSGCITIISELPATQDLLPGELQSCFVKPADAQNLALKLIEMIFLTRSARQQLSDQLRDNAKRYDYAIIARDYFAIYQRLIKA